MSRSNDTLEIAVIGMAGRFPGADHVAAFWQNLELGRETIATFSPDALRAAGVDERLLADPAYVPAAGVLDGPDLFDAGFFGVAPQEAALLDPQRRIFLECAWQALEDAGYDPATCGRTVGVFAGESLNGYLLEVLRARAADARGLSALDTLVSNDKDHLTTFVSYKLDLRGPSVAVQTACSTSLVAVHLACHSLLLGECDLALAGGVTVRVPHRAGYLFEPEGIRSPDGHCRAFDAGARGTVFGSGAGIVVLKRLDEALADRDSIVAVIRSSAINNDGAAKVGYTAPGVGGQAAVIATALAVAGVDPASVGYVEAHGTGTPLGDPIELAALTEAFRGTSRTGFCALGSVKTNVGHLETAAGIAGLIKAALAVQRGKIPPSLHFQKPNPEIDFAASPFRVNTGLCDWPADLSPRRAGVSSFGIGGTNAHVLLEEAPPAAAVSPAARRPLLALSARSPEALAARRRDLAEHLAAPGAGGGPADLADVAYTLQVGRRAFAHRWAAPCASREEALRLLADAEAGQAGVAPESGPRRVVFLFPGQGAQRPGMGADLYREEPVFRASIDRSAEAAGEIAGRDLREMLEPAVEGDSSPLDRTELAQPALFAFELALAELWGSWGIRPAAMIGHSLGEYVAACLAGVWTPEEALALVAARARRIQALPPGAMLVAALAPTELELLLEDGLALAAVNSPRQSVASGPEDEIAALAEDLTRRGVAHRRLATRHAFHAPLLEPVLAPFAEEVARSRPRPPRLPFVSSLTGRWITEAEATDPRYWAGQMRRTVLFADGLAEIAAWDDALLVEVGPGRALAAAVRESLPGREAVASLDPGLEHGGEGERLLAGLARLWTAGAAVSWPEFHQSERRRRVPLPTYPFERRRFWVDPPAESAPEARFHALSWRLDPAPPVRRPRREGERWLLLGGGGLTERLAAGLRADGAEVVVAERGERFLRLAGDRFRVRPERRADLQALFEDLALAGRVPQAAMDLWSVAPPPNGNGGPAAPAAGRCAGLTALAEGLAAPGGGEGRRPRLVLVASGAEEVESRDEVRSEAAVAAALGRGLAGRFPGLDSRVVDVEAPGGDGEAEALAGRLLAEIARDGGTARVALRGARRWLSGFVPLQLDEAPAEGGLAPGGCLLVSGDIRAFGAPALAALAELGAPPVFLQTDRGDAEALGRAIAALEEEQGALGGVLHALDGGGEVEALLERESRALEALDAALASRPRLARLLVSPPDAPVAAAWAEAWRRCGARSPWLHVTWSAAARPEDLRRMAAAPAAGWIFCGEDPDRYLAHPAGAAAAPAPPAEEPAASRAHPRPPLPSKFVAPTNETERAVARIWERLLGVEPVGIQDDFFRLGGHSLIGTQLIAGVCTSFEVDLPLSRLAELRTVAALARAIAEQREARERESQLAILDRVARLSEDEVRAEIERRAAAETRST
jgi:phthiocerol/phenolphthiocerol synthesis type-I polyketide synthase E